MSTPCFICGSTSQDFVCRKNEFDLYRCTSCGLVRVDPPPSKEQLDHYYREAYNQYRFSFEGPLAEPSRNRMHGLKVLERFRNPGRLLDVGSAYGHFLDNARRYGWKVEGVEPLNEARILAESRFRFRVFESLAAAPAAAYDVVTLWHVVEHLPAPVEFLNEARGKIADGGLLAVATPNILSLSARLTGQSWGWLSPPDHVAFYSRSTLRRLIEQCGFDIIHTETGRGPARNILLLLIQGIVYRMGLFRAVKVSVQQAAYESRSSRSTIGRFNLFAAVQKITDFLTVVLSPVLAVLWKMGLGDEVLIVARKKG